MESSVRRLTMAEARIEYLSTGDADPGAVSDFVAASWRRSRGAAVAADRGEVPFLGDIDIPRGWFATPDRSSMPPRTFP